MTTDINTDGHRYRGRDQHTKQRQRWRWRGLSSFRFETRHSISPLQFSHHAFLCRTSGDRSHQAKLRFRCRRRRRSSMTFQLFLSITGRVVARNGLSSGPSVGSV